MSENYLEQFVLLEVLSGHIEWEVIRIDDSSDEGQIFGHHVREVVSDEHATHVQLDVLHDFAVVLQMLCISFAENCIKTCLIC